MATLTVWKFNDATGARQALQLLERQQKAELIEIVDAAIVTWPEGRKKPKTEQLHNMTGAGALGGLPIKDANDSQLRSPVTAVAEGCQRNCE